MEIFDSLSKFYTIYTTKDPVTFTRPNPPVFKPLDKFKFKPFVKPEIYGLSEFIKTQAIMKKNKTLIDMYIDEKSQAKKQINQIKTEGIIGLGLVGFGLWAAWAYLK